MLNDEIRESLWQQQDKKYRDFQSRLIPTVTYDAIIGVRTPILRTYAKSLLKEADVHVFLNELPHVYFEENQLHAFMISEMRDYSHSIKELCHFLPYVDNWATCDQLSPKVFKKHRTELLEWIRIWIAAPETYTIRFAIRMLMVHFLDTDFDPMYPVMVAKISSDEYYVNMMIAWYFATALAKQFETVLPFIQQKRLDTWTHNKAIQKSLESRRFTHEQKAYLKSLKIK